MRLIHSQRQLRERGRIRQGYSTLRQDGKKIPHRSETYILSAPDRTTIDQVASVLGGQPEEWSDGGQDRYRVVTKADSLRVVLSAGMALSQRYDQYRKGFPVITCDGQTCWTPGKGRLDARDCVCDPDNRDCSLTTMLSVILPDLPGVGSWRLVTHSWYGAAELLATVELIESVMAVGALVPGRLFLTHREVRRLIDGKPEVRKFTVSALDLDQSVAVLGSGAPGGALPSPSTSSGVSPLPSQTPERNAPPAPTGWHGVDQAELPPAPIPNVRGALADVERPVKRRANAAPPIRRTGAVPRTEAEAVAASPNCSRCGLPYGQATLLRNPDPGGSRFIHARCATDDNESPQEGERPTPQPAPDVEDARPSSSSASKGEQQYQGRDGGGAAGVGVTSAGAQPAPVTARPSSQTTSGAMRMAPDRHRQVMALSSEVWPKGDLSGREHDELKRTLTLALVGLLGQPGLTSRNDITASTGQLLVDALNQLKDGSLVLTDRGLVSTATGEVTLAPPPGWSLPQPEEKA